MTDILMNILTVLYSFSTLMLLLLIYWALKFYKKTQIVQKIIAGILIGLMVVFFREQNSDTMTIALSISGIFFGIIPTLIASGIAITFRVAYFFVKDAGIDTLAVGVSSVVIATAAGILWNKLKGDKKIIGFNTDHYFFSLILHVIIVSTYYGVPNGFEIVKEAAPIMILAFPLMSLFLANILKYFKQQFVQQDIIINQRVYLRQTLNATDYVEIFSVDVNGNYLFANRFHQEQMRRFYNVESLRGTSYLKHITSEEMKKRISENIKKALEGNSSKIVAEVEVTEGKFLKETYSSMKDDNGNIIGVTITSEDITESVVQQNKIVEMSYKDPLTQVYNRRYFSELLPKIDKEENLPITFVFLDVNGLKLMNDAFGHAAGDDLLIAVADTLSKHLSEYGDLCRIGGDEFAVAIPKIDKEELRPVIETMFEEIDLIKIRSTSISVSCGLETKVNGDDINLIIKTAEDKMYNNKIYAHQSHRKSVIQSMLESLLEVDIDHEKRSKRITNLTKKMGIELGLSKQDLRLLEYTSNLYEIGKIGINRELFHKDDLTEKEIEEIKRHPEVGYRILLASSTYAPVAEDVLRYKERYDGKGYPDGLKGDEIPLRSRIIAIVNRYDKLIFEKKLSKEIALEEIKQASGTFFDPKLVDIFLKVAK